MGWLPLYLGELQVSCGTQEMLDEGKLGVRGGEVGLKKALNPKKKIPFALKEKLSLSHNTRLFRFALQSPEHQLGLPVGQHMFFYCKVSTRTSPSAYLVVFLIGSHTSLSPHCCNVNHLQW